MASESALRLRGLVERNDRHGTFALDGEDGRLDLALHHRAKLLRGRPAHSMHPGRKRTGRPHSDRPYLYSTPER